MSFSGQEMEGDYTFKMSHVITGSVEAHLTAYPNVVSAVGIVLTRGLRENGDKNSNKGMVHRSNRNAHGRE